MGIYAKTYGHTTNTAIAGDQKRFQWRAQDKDERFLTSHMSQMRNFGHPGHVEDVHLTYTHRSSNPNRTNATLKAAPELVSKEKHHHLPGYGGFVPGVYAKNMYGKSIYETTDKAIGEQETLKAIDDAEKRAVTAPDPRETGRLLFKPEGYLFQKRMAGDWNNGNLGARNNSSVRLDDRGHFEPSETFQTSHVRHFEGHARKDVPPTYSKYPAPSFQNMGSEERHPSMYQGYFPL